MSLWEKCIYGGETSHQGGLAIYTAHKRVPLGERTREKHPLAGLLKDDKCYHYICTQTHTY